jgi:Raf kinase inhibitor-like YbhB/YbcL family protein
MPLRLFSDALEPGGVIPARHTCEGDNVSPALRFDGVPGAAQSLALIVDDPDALNGVFAHWVLYNLPAELGQIEEGFTPDLDNLDGPAQGRNDFGNDHYEGPCPPTSDGEHRYYFRLYALDQRLDLLPGATRAQVLAALQGHIVAQTELMVRHARAGVPAELLGQGSGDWEFDFYSEIPNLDIEALQRLRAEAESRLGELTRGNHDMIGASVAVEPVAAGQNQEPIRYRARVVVYIRPDNIAASEQDDTGEAALQRTLDVIERLVREHRAKLREPHKHQTQPEEAAAGTEP